MSKSRRKSSDKVALANESTSESIASQEYDNPGLVVNTTKESDENGHYIGQPQKQKNYEDLLNKLGSVALVKKKRSSRRSSVNLEAVSDETKQETSPDQVDPENTDGRTMSMLQRNQSLHRIQEFLYEESNAPAAADTSEERILVKKLPALFCEMDQLRMGPNGVKEFHETARWLKFEENVEVDGQRWSKPHVAALSLHSLFQLRDLFNSKCTYSLDIEVRCRADIMEYIVDRFIDMDLVEKTKRESLFSTLMSKVNHLHAPHKSMNIMKNIREMGSKKTSHLELNSEPSSASLSSLASQAAAEVHKQNIHFRKKIPKDAVAANVMLATLPYIKEPIMAFMRLRQSILLGDVTEVEVPTKFVVVLLANLDWLAELHEIGRCISTLMSDEIFHQVAYKGTNLYDFLAGLDEFLDEVTILPPSEWDPTVRLEPPKIIPNTMTRKKAIIVGSLVNPLFHLDREEDEKTITPLSESHCDSTTLIRSGRLFGGLIADIKRKIPVYRSDFKDALHVQCIAAVFFMYFACLTPIVTFGGLLGLATRNGLGVMENIVAGSMCGVSFHLLAGQPLTIIGSTGPVLVFEQITVGLCDSVAWSYLSFRFWIGLWTCFLLIGIVALDLSAWVKYITRFTEEAFAFLIALIFIAEAIGKVLEIGTNYPYGDFRKTRTNYTCNCYSPNVTIYNNSVYDDSTYMMYRWNWTANNYTGLNYKDCLLYGGKALGPGCGKKVFRENVFFFSILIFLGTFVLAMFLKEFRNYRFFPTNVKSILSDFSVMIAILTFCIIDYSVGVNTPKLLVPEKFQPTSPDRTWLIHPFNGNPWWSSIVASIGGCLATILIFMDQQITAVIVNRKDHLLVKGQGYHLDLIIVALQIGVCSVMGLPYFVAATVESKTHVRSLSKESECSAPGEQPKFLGVREQRVTGSVVFLLVGLCVFFTKILKFVPMPVLYGVFLYMGINSLRGVQLMDRIKLYFIPVKFQEDCMFLRHVRLKRVHIFTAIQVLCLILLWVIKKIKQVSILFPIMVLALCAIRKIIERIFTEKELKWLDDIMPESERKRQLKNKKKKKEAEALAKGIVKLLLPSGETIEIVLDNIKYDTKTKQIKIDESMNPNIEKKYASLITQNSMDDSYEKLPSPISVLSNNKKKSTEDLESEKNVSFYINDEIKDQQVIIPTDNYIHDTPNNQSNINKVVPPDYTAF